jgi:hypothetical protein
MIFSPGSNPICRTGIVVPVMLCCMAASISALRMPVAGGQSGIRGLVLSNETGSETAPKTGMNNFTQIFSN